MPRTLDDLVAHMTASYPTLFGHRTRALAHLYIVIGCGYHWFEGRLSSGGDDGPAPSFDAWLARYVRGGDGHFTAEERRAMALEAVEKAKAPLDHLYPLSDYANACRVPKDVEDDYLEGAIDALVTHASLAAQQNNVREFNAASAALRALREQFHGRFTVPSLMVPPPKAKPKHAPYLVAFEHPFYPTVHDCTSLAEAAAKRDAWLAENHADDGQHACRVIIAQVLSVVAYRGHF